MICILLVAGHGTVLETQIKVSSLNVCGRKGITTQQCKVRISCEAATLDYPGLP